MYLLAEPALCVERKILRRRSVARSAAARGYTPAALLLLKNLD